MRLPTYLLKPVVANLTTMSLILPRLISCDEAGFTGNDLLGVDQPHFAYASHDLSLGDAEALLREARSRFPVQMPELKARQLLRSARGRDLLEFVLDRVDGRYIATVYDKRLALCCKVFEYIYEPVLKSNSKLFYDNGLHRFVAMFLYVNLVASSADMGLLAREFEAFMRTLDPASAPTLLGAESDPDPEDPLTMIRRFARGYNFAISQETRTLRETGDTGKWVLDLSLTALFSHLTAWGQRHPLLDVVCDDSKPLRALTGAFDAMINRSDSPTLNILGTEKSLSWNMSGPITFEASDRHAGVQLADLLAGCTAVAPGSSGREELRPLASRIAMNLNDECIMPDMAVIDPVNDDAAVNFFILGGLAIRADAGEDPLERMDMMYEAAKKSLPLFRSGKFS